MTHLALGFIVMDRGELASAEEEFQRAVKLDEALDFGDEAAITHELGDVLLSVVNLGRFLPVGSEESLRAATGRFETRFRHLERRLHAEGRSIHETDLDTLEAYWQRAKRET